MFNFDFLRKAKRGGVATAGWFVMAKEAGVIWDGPRPMTLLRGPQKSPKSALACPAVIDYDARLVEFPCPVDLKLRFARDKDGKPALVNAGGPNSPITKSKLSSLVTLTSEGQWRHPSKPIVQVSTPYRFISDDLVYLNQYPAFHHYKDPPAPGFIIGGRFPIDAWPRPMMWAFEWCDPTKPLIWKRGEPWFYARFESDDPKAQVRVVEAEITPDLEKLCRDVESVTNYVNRTYSLFARARAMRPKTLLVEKKT